MRVLIAIVLTCLLLTACSGGDSRSGRGAAPTSTPSSSAETSVGAEVRADDPALSHVDASGRTPDAVLLALIEAWNSSDWAAAYSMYAAPEVDFATFVENARESNEHFKGFRTWEVRVIDKETAIVRVTYETPTSVVLNGKTSTYTVVVQEPGEWWEVNLVDGVWKVKWLPRQ